MKPLKIKLVLFALVCTALYSCNSEEEGIYFDEINEIKVEYTTMELEIQDNISSVASSHSSYMIEMDQVNHDGFPKRQENLVLQADAKAVAENVSNSFNSATGAVNALLNSEDNRAIIENDTYTHVGISIEQNRQGINYFTQIFIKK